MGDATSPIVGDAFGSALLGDGRVIGVVAERTDPDPAYLAVLQPAATA